MKNINKEVEKINNEFLEAQRIHKEKKILFNKGNKETFSEYFTRKLFNLKRTPPHETSEPLC